MRPALLSTCRCRQRVSARHASASSTWIAAFSDLIWPARMARSLTSCRMISSIFWCIDPRVWDACCKRILRLAMTFCIFARSLLSAALSLFSAASCLEVSDDDVEGVEDTFTETVGVEVLGELVDGAT